eukprot:scaffold3221_cov105-Cylindrotheca_fusiformis.AAC.1
MMHWAKGRDQSSSFADTHTIEDVSMTSGSDPKVSAEKGLHQGDAIGKFTAFMVDILGKHLVAHLILCYDAGRDVPQVEENGHHPVVLKD